MWSPGMIFATEAVKMLGAPVQREGGALTFGLGGVVDAFSLFALADGAANSGDCHADFQVVDRTA